MNKLVLSIGTFDVIFNDPVYTELRKKVEKEIIRVAKAYRIYLPFRLYECSDKDLGLVIKFIKTRMEQFAKRKARLQYFVNEAVGLEKFGSTLYDKELLGLEDEQIQQQQLQQQQFEQQQQNDQRLLEFNQQQQQQQFQQQQKEEFESSNINFDREIEQTFHYEQQQQGQQQQQQVSSLEKEELKQINKSVENVFLTESDLIAQYDQQQKQQQQLPSTSSSSIIINRLPINNLHMENKTLENSHEQKQKQKQEEESFDSSSDKTYFETLKPLDNKNVHDYDPNKFTDEDFDYLLTMTFAKEDDISYDSEGEGELASIIPGTLTYDAMKAKEEAGELNEYTNYDRNVGNYVKKICKFDPAFKRTYAEVTGNPHPLNSDLDD